MPTSLEHSPKYRCRNGTWHDIPNTTHLRKKGGRKEEGLKEYITKWDRIGP